MEKFSFSVMPSVSISRSRFERKHTHKTSFNMGEIIPIYVDEVLPGDTRSMDLAALVRMSTPIAPIMDNVYLDYHAFFVPNRLTWKHWKEFMGENNEGAGIPAVEYSIPYVEMGGDDPNTRIGTAKNYFDYLGIPGDTPLGGQSGLKVSALPLRGLALIYNRWYRNQNLIAPLAVETGDANDVIIGDSDGGTFSLDILKASKIPDYFVSSLPYAQKSAPVSIPLGTTAPIITQSDLHWNNLKDGTTNPNLIRFGYAGTEGIEPFTAIKQLGNFSSGVGTFAADPSASSIGAYVTANNLAADLSQATATTINQLRYAFQLQKLLEKDALYGTRYWEILAAHFGVESPDASLQDPEYLGGKRMYINIDQVLSTAGYDASDATQVGAPGANSVSGFKGSLFTKSFTEHGYLFICAVARHDQTYGQGINRMWTRRGRYDFYFPVFANLGAQDVKVKEIYAKAANPDALFGYQEAWAEYRYHPSIVSGLLNPNRANSLDFWTLANKFDAAPTLSKSFIEQDRNAISRALVSGSNGPDFIADFMFRDIAVRPMPVFSIPGLVDHH